jgi:hypothetical protein
MGTVQLVLAPDSVRADLTAETAARIAADAAIVASGATPANVGLAPVVPTGSATTKAVNDWLGPVAAMLPKTPAATSVAVGAGTLDHATTGAYNVAVGVSALHANTSGVANVAVGSEALDASTTGSYNTAVGLSALGVDTTGGFNTAVGSGALAANTTANANVAVGSDALAANTTGAGNVAVGHNALVANTTGGDNTVIGSSTGAGLTTGSGNTILGAGITVATTTANNIILASGNAARATFNGTNWAFTGVVTAGGIKASAASATITTILLGSRAWTPGTIGAGAENSEVLTVTGAALGDLVLASSTDATASAYLRGFVVSADTVMFRIYNTTAGNLVCPAATFTAVVIKVS